MLPYVWKQMKAILSIQHFAEIVREKNSINLLLNFELQEGNV